MRSQPGETWPEKVLASIEAGDALSGREVPLEDYEGPGANSYHSALEQLVEAAIHVEDRQKRATHAVDAIAGGIMATMTENWGSRNRERWDHWYQAAISGTMAHDQRVLGALAEMKHDPSVGTLRRQYWMELADEFEWALSK